MNFIKEMIKAHLIKNKALNGSLVVNFCYLIYQFVGHYFSSGFKYFRVSRLSNLKSSDTLVILGAGSTINELSIGQLEELNGYDVAGLSYSCILPIKQKFYFYESPSAHEKDLMLEHANKILPVILENKKKGRLNELIWKNSENKTFNQYFKLKQFVCPNVCSILSDNLRTIKKILKYCKKLGLNKYFLLQKRGSVTALVQFGTLLKYKKIVFVGVDLNTNKYFFENNKKYIFYNFADPYSFDNIYKSNVHRTNDPKIGIPIIEVLKIFFEEETNIQFYVSSKDSALIDYLPLWNWQRT